MTPEEFKKLIDTLKEIGNSLKEIRRLRKQTK